MSTPYKVREKHLPVLGYLVRPEDANYLLVSRIQRRAHVRLHRVPAGIDRSLAAGEDCGDRLVLRRVQSKLLGETVEHMMSIRSGGRVPRRAMALKCHADNHPGGQRHGEQQRSLRPGRYAHLTPPP